jgi:hypothetical protein
MSIEERIQHLRKEIADRHEEYCAGMYAFKMGGGSDIWHALENKRIQLRKLEAELDQLHADQRPT